MVERPPLPWRQLLPESSTNPEKKFSKKPVYQASGELMEKFSELTACTRMPLTGLCQESGGKTIFDENMMREVMAGNHDHDRWTAYGAQLEQRFQRDKSGTRTPDKQALTWSPALRN
jgi:hypothetical protein